jgi:DNA-directed RNA polymerase subunit beta
MTERASFIIKGVERVPIAQLLPHQGLSVRGYAVPDGEKWRATLRPRFGPQIEVTLELGSKAEEKWRVQVGRWSGTQVELAIHMGWEPGPVRVYGEAREPHRKLFSQGILLWLDRQEKEKLDRQFKLILNNQYKEEQSHDTMLVATPLRPEHLLGMVEAIRLARKDKFSSSTDPEDLANQTVLLVGDHLEQAVWKGASVWLRRLVWEAQQKDKEKERERRSLDDWLRILPNLIRSEIDHYLTSSLCQPLDRTNPLAEVSHKRKVTRYGPGGLPEDYRDFAYRDVHPSHYGRLCPVETPESMKLGLTLHFAAFAQVHDGNLEAPFINPKTQKVEWLKPADERERKVLTTVPDSPLQPALARSVNPEKELVDLTVNAKATPWVDAARGECLGLAASLIPFIQHDDVNRALMGAKNLKQALPLKRPELPLVRTGHETIVGTLSGRAIRSRCDGEVTQVIDPAYSKGRVVVGDIVYSIPEPTEGWLGSRLAYRPIVRVGDTVQKGQVLAEGPAMIGDTLALGVNLLVAYVPWKGYNFEDGIVVSDRLVREHVLTSLHHYDLKFPLQPGEVTGYRKVAPHPELHFDEYGLVRTGTEVWEGMLLANVWRLSKGDCRTTQVVMRTDAGTQEYMAEADARAIRVPPGIRGKVEDVMLVRLERQKHLLRVVIAGERPVQVGDKLMGRHGNKGVVTTILPEADMPHLEDGTAVDVILNPLGVVGRLNLGQLIETHMGLVIRHKDEAGRTFAPFQQVDLEQLQKELADIGFQGGKARLRHGREGQFLDAPVTVGYQYMVKLNHLAESKLQARDTGPYAPVVQQAVKGRRVQGGQRVGEMELWALLAHGAEATLEELFAPRADDLKARASLGQEELGKRWRKSLRDFTRSVPETFRVVLCYLRALGLEVTLNGKPIDPTVEELQRRRPQDLTNLMLALAVDKTVVGWGKTVDTYPWHRKAIWGKFSCGCEGDREQLFYPGKRYLCRNHPSKIEIKDCGHKGLSSALLKVADDGSLRCTMCLKTGVVQKCQKIELAPGVKPIHSIGLRREDQAYREGGLFGTDVFGSARMVQVKPCGHSGPYQELVGIKLTRTGERGCCTRCHKLVASVSPDDRGRRSTWGVISLAETVGHPLRRSRDRRAGTTTYSYKIKVLPVLPPGLRPHGRETAPGSDLNVLYERVIKRNHAVTQIQKQLAESARLADTSSPVLQDRRDKAVAALQKSVDELIVDGAWVAGCYRRSILGHLTGKAGLIRHALMGKRVDGSGRAVIVADPDLAPDQMALPVGLASELFGGLSRAELEVFLRKRDVRVLLNRQPSLHRYNILALRPMLWDHQAIGLPPLITPGFNADFDGDTMAVYLTVLAQKDAHRMEVTRHLLSVANGDWMLATGHELAAGIHVATGAKAPTELAHRDLAAKNWNQKELRERLVKEWLEQGPKAALVLAKTAADLAFETATQAGLTLSHFDLEPIRLTWADKERLGMDPDKWEKAVHAKSAALDVRHPLRVYLESGTKLTSKTLNQMAGGRGVINRLRVVAGAPPVLIRSNFYEGMHPLEFFASAHGSRSSLADKKLGVSHTGTFTRHLVHAAFDLRITDKTCSETQGIVLTDLRGLPERKPGTPDTDWSKSIMLPVRFDLRKRLVGRVTLEDIAGTSIKAGDLLDEAKVKDLTDKVFALRVRSPFTCKSGPGRICAACYGWDPSTRQLPGKGTWVGIIAGQSIGERATQLTFRTFHSGGAKGETDTSGFTRIRRLFAGGKLDVRSAGENVEQPRTLWDMLYAWEEEQAKSPTASVGGPVVVVPNQTKQAVLALTPWDLLLSATHMEFFDAYKGSVHEKHAEVILRALKDTAESLAIEKSARMLGIERAAGNPMDWAGALAFGRWRDCLKQIRDDGRITLSLKSARARIMLSLMGR